MFCVLCFVVLLSLFVWFECCVWLFVVILGLIFMFWLFVCLELMPWVAVDCGCFAFAYLLFVDLL